MIYVNEHNKNRYGIQDKGRRYGSLPEEIVSETKMLHGFVVFDKYKKRDYSKDTIFYFIADEKWVYVDPYSKRKKRPQD